MSGGGLWSSFKALFNPTSGIGGSGDHAGATYTGRPDLAPQTITALLKHAPLVRTACEIMPEDVCRAWRIHPANVSKWVEVEEKLDLIGVAERALFYSEAYGGAFVMPRYSETVVTAERLAQPYAQPRQGTLLGFSVFAPHQLRRASGTENMSQPDGLPQFYEFTIDQSAKRLKVHYSWMKAVRGAMTADIAVSTHSSVMSLHGMLGASKVDLIHDDFMAMLSANQAISHFLVKSNIDVLKLKGLADAMSKCGTSQEMGEQVQKLVQQAAITISGANAFQPMVVDTEEELERKTSANLGGPDIVDRLVSTFVAATRIPRTRLLGEQSKGLANGGDADLTIYYDRCDSMRNRRLTPVLNWCDDLIKGDGGPAIGDWNYGPLYNETPKAQGEIDKANADVDKIYLDMDIPFLREKIAKRLIESGRYDFSPEQIKVINELDTAEIPDEPEPPTPPPIPAPAAPGAPLSDDPQG